MDAQTGREAWRFYTIARPGEPGGNSWNGLPVDKRNGASVWVPASYDQKLNLAFFGPAQTYDTGPLRNPSDEGDVTNDGLYTDSTLAINVDTGSLVWFFQHQPNDQWDYDWAFERQVLQLPVNGTQKTRGRSPAASRRSSTRWRPTPASTSSRSTSACRTS